MINSLYKSSKLGKLFGQYFLFPWYFFVHKSNREASMSEQFFLELSEGFVVKPLFSRKILLLRMYMVKRLVLFTNSDKNERSAANHKNKIQIQNSNVGFYRALFQY